MTTVGVIASIPSNVSPEISISRYFLNFGSFYPDKPSIMSSRFVFRLRNKLTLLI